MVIEADTSDVYVRNSQTRERFNYYSPDPRSGCAAWYEDARTELSAIEQDPNAGEDSLWAVITTELVNLLDEGASTQSVGHQQRNSQARVANFHERLHELMGQETDAESINNENSTILLPSSYILSCYPNPFNPTTTISFNIPKTERIVMKVYDVTGREIIKLADKVFEAGENKLQFDGAGLPSGIYFAQLEAGAFTKTQKLVLLK